jgi:hypothetical protein
MSIPEISLEEKKKAIDKWLDKMMVNYYTINDDLTIDVNGSVDLNGKGLDKLPYKFGHVSEYFSCERNYLTDMNNMPATVGKDFYVDDNALNTLIGMPKVRGNRISFKKNQITTLQGLDPEFKGILICRDNQLKNLDYVPAELESLVCEDNPFEFANQIITGLPRIKTHLVCNGELFRILLLPENRHWITPEQVGGILNAYLPPEGTVLEMFRDGSRNINMPWKDVCRYFLMQKLDNEIEHKAIQEKPIKL